MPEYKEVRPEKRTNKGYELVVYSFGYKEWYLNGKRHRVDGPAIEDSDGQKSWWFDGHLSRLDGPAIEDDGDKEWFLKGKELTKDWFLENPDKIKKMKAWELFTPEELVRLKNVI